MVNKMWFPILLVFTLGSLITKDNMIQRRNESLPDLGGCIVRGLEVGGGQLGDL